MNSHSNSPQPQTVSELTEQIKETLGVAFAHVWVAGEISDLARPRSGHIYLTLKDEAAQIRAVIWRGVATKLPFQLEDGQAVLCSGRVDVYPPRGSYQLIIDQIEPQGIGALQIAFQQMFERLSAEGLFAPERKRTLPRFPKRIAFVTSPTGAAVRDFLEVVRRRWQNVQVLVIPAKVQGEGAAQEIVKGIETANGLSSRPDVLVVGRGGGSMEDLWCFNEEPVVRAIVASKIPVVSAVGHEIDVTLSDLAADVRALTPTEAAERIVPSTDELTTHLQNLQQRIRSSLRNRASDTRRRLDNIAGRRIFVRPFDRVQELTLRLDELENRASRSATLYATRAKESVGALAAHLESLSPLAVLARGYSVTQRTSDGAIVRDSRTVSSGDLISTKLANGSVVSRVEESLPEDD